jgi:hypothetical protein
MSKWGIELKIWKGWNRRWKLSKEIYTNNIDIENPVEDKKGDLLLLRATSFNPTMGVIIRPAIKYELMKMKGTWKIRVPYGIPFGETNGIP